MKRIIAEKLFIAGWEHYEGESVFPDMRLGQKVTLRREPDNKHDSNAIEVLWGDVKIGHVPRAVAGPLALIMDEMVPVAADESGADWVTISAAVSAREISSNPWKRLAIDIHAEVA